MIRDLNQSFVVVVSSASLHSLFQYNEEVDDVEKLVMKKKVINHQVKQMRNDIDEEEGRNNVHSFFLSFQM